MDRKFLMESVTIFATIFFFILCWVVLMISISISKGVIIAVSLILTGIALVAVFDSRVLISKIKRRWVKTDE